MTTSHTCTRPTGGVDHAHTAPRRAVRTAWDAWHVHEADSHRLGLPVPVRGHHVETVLGGPASAAVVAGAGSRVTARHHHQPRPPPPRSLRAALRRHGELGHSHSPLGCLVRVQVHRHDADRQAVVRRASTAVGVLDQLVKARAFARLLSTARLRMAACARAAHETAVWDGTALPRRHPDRTSDQAGTHHAGTRRPTRPGTAAAQAGQRRAGGRSTLCRVPTRCL